MILSAQTAKSKLRFTHSSIASLLASICYAPPPAVTHVAVSQDLSLIVASAADLSIYLFDLGDGGYVQRIAVEDPILQGE